MFIDSFRSASYSSMEIRVSVTSEFWPVRILLLVCSSPLRFQATVSGVPGFHGRGEKDVGEKSAEVFFFYHIGQFRECQEPLWAKFKAKYRFRQCQGEHTGFSSWLGPHVFPLGLVWSC